MLAESISQLLRQINTIHKLVEQVEELERGLDHEIKSGCLTDEFP